MKDKQELLQDIEELPLYEKRDVQVRDEDGNFVADDKHKAICKVNDDEPLAFVGPAYNLVQMRDVFKPVVENVKGDVKGRVQHYRGFASLIVMPEGDELKVGNSKIGLVAMNSVDCSSSVVVKFCARQENGRVITLPPKVAGIKKAHTNQAVTLVEDYMRFVGKVKKAWETIITEFPEYRLILDEKEAENIDGPTLMLGDTMQKLNIGKRLSKKIKTKYETLTADGHPYSLWDLFIDALDTIDDTKHKTEIHRQRKIDQLTQAVYEYSVLIAI